MSIESSPHTRYSIDMSSDSCHITVIPLGNQRKPHELQSLLDCIAIREMVFVEEQHVPIMVEQDGKDNESGHVLMWFKGAPVGTLRFRDTNQGVKLERIAILKEFRGRHLGKLLIREGVRAARMNGLSGTIFLHAQQQAAALYASLGFKETGERTIEANISHVTMHLGSAAEATLLEMDPDKTPCDL